MGVDGRIADEPVDVRQLRVIATKGAVVVAARQGGANDQLLHDGREQRGTYIGLQVEGDLLIFYR